uniref:Fatty acid hydroxylase domain-containing protein n=1 Tax=Chromera velia CCMP2878 TaxID=1169474 RepID=A0A0G4IF10_9ALVE|eukprot:Cvel_2452.t1-p1 / transcript=Cvel_2452.t1 / gene=Cvel_2452 / organism=Chromera_velia_CCMP2878 / gene_product=Alkylglycerol monooxygenase, putative / transcript_product=Alkylglycerol monooxygenase, putative / location=Cvel_scaffold96:50673-52135(+) / protein_length=370 / sequence_SO=supercontig / SO=protein_coding / is_pseudo=false
MWGQVAAEKSFAQVFLERLGVLFYIVKPFDPDTPVSSGEEAESPDFIQQAIPFFILLCLVEGIVGAVWRGKSVYRWNDLVCSYGLGLLQTVVSFFVKLIQVPLYVWIYENIRLVSFDRGDEQTKSVGEIWGLWLWTIFLVDFLYYWFHRCSHEFQGMWAAHSVHHSGETLNLSTALRQGAYQPVLGVPFALVCALLGIPPSMYCIHGSLNTLVQFWIHTELVWRLPFGLEYVLNSASHHRLHHHYPGNCNYGGFLIVFDRVFGTFVAELKQEDDYGLAEQMTTLNPVLVNVRQFEKFRRRVKGRFFARRARHPWLYFSLGDLFKPLPPPLRTLPLRVGGKSSMGGAGSWTQKRVSTQQKVLVKGGRRRRR